VAYCCGGGESRTPVRKGIPTGIYMFSPFFSLALTSAADSIQSEPICEKHLIIDPQI